MVGKSKNRIKITLSLDKDLVKQVKHEAIEKETDMSSIVEQLLRKFLKN